MTEKNTVIYACSGCSDAGELADRTARTLSREGIGEMSCLAGIGGQVKPLLAKAQNADRIVVIDGCPLNCARHTLEQAGFRQYLHLQLQNIGFRKGSCPPTSERVEMAARAAARLIEAGNQRAADGTTLNGTDPGDRGAAQPCAANAGP